MAFPNITFRTELDPTSRKELDAFSAQLAGFLQAAGFEADGNFTINRSTELITESGTFGTLTVTGEATFEDATAETFTTQLLKLTPQSSYTPSAGDTAALSDGPLYSVYRLTPSANREINGIFTDVATGAPGHVLVLWNDSNFAVTFRNAVVSNARQILGGPCVIGPNGCACLIYDNTDLGWRISWSQFGDPLSYTPTWTGAGGNPSLGDGTLTGEYVCRDRICEFTIKLTIGSTTTLGTGVWSFTLPQTAANGTVEILGAALIQDATYITGTTLKATTTTCQVAPQGGATLVSPTVPVAWPAGDLLYIKGTFKI